MKRKLIFLFLSIWILTSCAQEKAQPADSICIATWNVQNLFDGNDDGNEYDEYTSDGGWTDNQYRVRLKKINTVLGYDGLKEAQIIVLNEVENENVVQDILGSSELKGRGFKYYACCSEADGAISIAVVSSLPMTDAFVHAIQGQRPILEVDYNLAGGTLTVFAVHGKSNLGDEKQDREIRETEGSALEELISQKKKENTQCTIVIAGDFNEDAQDGNIIANISQWDNFWDRNYPLDSPGSYYYQDEWEKYDNILLQRNSSWTLKEGNTVFYGILMNQDRQPDSWKRYLLSGVSDHLPVWIKIGR